MEEDNNSKLLAIEFYRQAGEYVKAALYSFFLLNGGAITAILARSSNISYCFTYNFSKIRLIHI